MLDNFSPHLTTKKDNRVGDWLRPTMWSSRTPRPTAPGSTRAQFTPLRYFTLDGAGHRGHQEQGSMIRRYIIWRNRHADDTRLRQVVARANVA